MNIFHRILAVAAAFFVPHHAFTTCGSILPRGRWTISHTNDKWLTKLGPAQSVWVDHRGGFRVNRQIFGTFRILPLNHSDTNHPLRVDVSMALWNIPMLAKDFKIYPVNTHRILLTNADESTYYYLDKVG